MKKFTVAEINSKLGGIIVGDFQGLISGPENIENATEEHITFIGSKKYEKLWKTSKACVAIVNDDVSIEPGFNRGFIKVSNADLAMSIILEMFAKSMPFTNTDVHPTANVDSTVLLGDGVKISAGCYVGPGVSIGNNTILYPNVTVLDNCKIGENTVLWPGVVVRERSLIGSNCIIHPNATIGADGFGFRPCPKQGLAKIIHIGNVVIEDCVEIGANSCIDRGKFSSTIIGYGSKIDNLVQIGHNSILGKFCIMAGNSGLAGSVKLGDGVMIGGSASIKDHTTIGDRAIIGAGSGVTSDVEAGKTMLGYPALEIRDTLKQWAFVKRLVKETKKQK